MNRVVHFNIQVDDIDRAKRFYEKIFGWKIEKVMTKEESGMMDYWIIHTGEGQGIDGGMLMRPEDKDNRVYRLCITVGIEDMDTVLHDVTTEGGFVEMEKSELPGVGFFASISDTEGNQLDLMQSTSVDPNPKPKFSQP